MCLVKRILMRLIPQNRRLFLYTLILAILSLPPGVEAEKSDSSCNSIFPPIPSGYGSDSINPISIVHKKPKLFRHSTMYLFRPETVSVRMPVVFFFHGMGESELRSYEKLLRHMASRGLCVALIRYRLKSFPFQAWTYRRMFRSCIEAAGYFGEYVDTTRIGFMGHSFGASAIPYLTRRFIIKRTWGEAGVFMYIMAPHYVFEISQEQLQQFPKQVKLIMEVFAEDDCNDHRMAKDIYETIGIPESGKEFIILFSDTNASTGCRIVADHAAPTNFEAGRETVDALDFYGVYRYIDALVDYTFNGTPAAKEIAFGHGSEVQRFMGTWPDGTPVREALIARDVPLVKPKSFYFFNWKHPWNLRRRRNDLWMPDSATWKP